MTDITPTAGAGGQRLSVVILTRNEEAMIERCLRSIDGLADDVLIVDADSTDRTREIAQMCGARVMQQSWLGWLRQRALGIASARHDWVMILEADEIVTPRLYNGVRDVLRGDMAVGDGYSIDRRDDFLGALLPRMRRRSKRLHFIRLFNRTASRYDPSLTIHEEVRVPGRVHPLPGALIHWRGFTILEQVARYVAYAPLEADVMQAAGRRVSVLSLLIRPILRFGWCYVACGGFRLGARGFAHALMVASSEYLRFASAWERQNAPAMMHPSQRVRTEFALDALPRALGSPPVDLAAVASPFAGPDNRVASAVSPAVSTAVHTKEVVA